LAIWIHPWSPLLSMLAGCRLMSNPSLVSICRTTTTMKSGPATMPQVSSVLVDPTAAPGALPAAVVTFSVIGLPFS
jgi:hypothetical protein